MTTGATPPHGSRRAELPAADQTLDDYTAWIVQSYSDVLCVDEVYQGDLALLPAVDPGALEGDRLVGYELVGAALSRREAA